MAWRPPPVQGQNGLIQGYRVFYRPAATSYAPPGKTRGLIQGYRVFYRSYAPLSNPGGSGEEGERAGDGGGGLNQGIWVMT